jgi:hypothetical protein
MHDKLELLRRLIAGDDVDTDDIPWDHIGTVLMRGVHVERMLLRYTNKQIDEESMKDWAVYLLSREDVVFEEKNESIIREVLDILATKNIQKTLSKSSIEGIFRAIA